MAENKRDSIIMKLVPVAFFVFCSQRLIEPGNVPEGRKVEPDGKSYVYICTFTDRQVRITAECYEIPPAQKDEASADSNRGYACRETKSSVIGGN